MPGLANSSAGEEWTVVKEKAGIVVSEKEVDGRNLPMFRGVTVIEESIFDILAVMQDTSRNVEWMHNCEEARRIEQLNEWEVFIYTRTGAPWPVSDRDVVIHTYFQIVPAEKKVLIDLKAASHQAQPLVDGVVRMPRLDGHYEFTMLSAKSTKVDFKVNAEPGGLLPRWVARMVSRDIPYKTLDNLRAQVKKTRGAQEYKSFIAKAKLKVNQIKTAEDPNSVEGVVAVPN